LSIDVKNGDRVEILEMTDTMSKLKKGDKGTVFKVEVDQDLIWVNWDNGEKLALLTDVDKFKIIKK
jgi:tricorn protease-like protein